MDVDDAFGPSRQAALHQLVISREVFRVQSATDDIVGEILPSYCKAEDVELVIGGKVLHLRSCVVGHVNAADFTVSVLIARKVKPWEVYTSVGGSSCYYLRLEFWGSGGLGKCRCGNVGGSGGH